MKNLYFFSQLVLQSLVLVFLFPTRKVELQDHLYLSMIPLLHKITDYYKNL